MKMIYDCGHSARTFVEFTTLLQSHGITLMVDVRSKPFSRWCPHFNKGFLEAHLPMQYLWMRELGGLEVIAPDMFDEAIEKLIRYAKHHAVCIVCSEKNHLHCHRHSRIEPALRERGVKLIHI